MCVLIAKCDVHLLAFKRTSIPTGHRTAALHRGFVSADEARVDPDDLLVQANSLRRPLKLCCPQPLAFLVQEE